MEALPYIIIRGQTGRLHGASPAAGAKKSAEKTPFADLHGAGGREGLSPPAASPSVTKRFRFFAKKLQPGDILRKPLPRNPPFAHIRALTAHTFQLCYIWCRIIDLESEGVLIYTHGGIPVA